MNYKEFLTVIETEMAKKVGPEFEISLQQMIRNNNTVFDSLIIMDPALNISPTIYLNPYYHRYLDGVAISDIISDIYLTYKTYMPSESIDTDFFTDYSQVRNNIIMKLINYDHNRKFLSDVPHVRYLDFAIIFQCYVNQIKDSSGTITIHHSHLKLWDVNPETLLEDAKRNTPRLFPYHFTSICDCLRELCFELDSDLDEFPDDVPSMFVLTNKKKLNGASAILYPGLLKKLSQKMESDLFLLPSSIHEFIIIPSRCEDFRQNLRSLTMMVREVNETEVSDEEYLSDQAYFYDRESGIIFENSKMCG